VSGCLNMSRSSAVGPGRGS